MKAWTLLVCVGVWICMLSGCNGDSKKELAQRAQCLGNLGKLGNSLHQYATEHDDKFPAALTDLALPAADTKCPGTKAQPYIYVPGLTVKDSPGTVVAYDTGAPHMGTCNVLTVDGLVRAMTPEDLAAALDGN